MLTRGGQRRSLEWFGQGRFTFLAPKDGHRDDAPIARDGFDKSQNVLIPLPSVLFAQHRRVNAPNQATLLPCKTRYSVIAGRLLQVARWAARAERSNRSDFRHFDCWSPSGTDAGMRSGVAQHSPRVRGVQLVGMLVRASVLAYCFWLD